MQPLKNFLEASIRTKVLVPVIMVMGLLLVMTVSIVNFEFRQQAEKSARSDLSATDLQFQKQLAEHQKSLRLRFSSLASEPMYLAALRTLNASTIRDSFRRMMEDEGLSNENIEFVFFSPGELPDAAESMLYQPNQLSSPRSIIAGSDPTVKMAQQGQTTAETVHINDKLYQLIAIPVYNEDHDQVVGAMIFGELVDDQVAKDSFNVAGKLVLIAGDSVIASTFAENEQPSDMVECFRELNHSDPSGLPAMKHVVIAGHNYFCMSGHFPSQRNDGSLGYLLYASYDAQLAALSQTQRLLLAAITMGIILGSAIVLFFINKATQPLRDLHDAAEAVGRGDFTKRVNIHTRDEFGELAQAFNQMTENIELSQSKLKQAVETIKNTQAQLIQSEKLSAVGEFVAGVAHELNNPLAAVMGFSEMLKNANVDEKHRRHLDMIFKSAQRCQKIVQSLLSFARRQQPERKPVQANQLIEGVLEMVAYPLRTSNVKVIPHLSPKLPLILADGHQIQQVVLNIINNARQAIEAHEGSGRITITTKHMPGMVRISIHDNGPGIAPENLRRIFDPFFTTKEVGKGTGLGLSLCYGIIREHGGNIVPESHPGHGTTFTIELPALSQDMGLEAPKATNGDVQSDRNEGAGKRILAVDDEESLLDMIKEELSRHSYEVTTAINGETALRTLKEKKFDVVLCDIKMPGLNGRQVYERLREEDPDTCRRMVFVTGDVVGEQLRHFLDTEKRPCIAKPFSLGELRQTIKTTLAEL